MEILQFVISLLSTSEGIKFITALLDTLFNNADKTKEKDEEFDPEIEAMFEEISGKRKNSPKIIGEGYALAPISNIADRDIIFSLNRYFASV